MIRIMSSTITVAASASDAVVASTISNLTDVIPASAIAHPYGISFTGTIPADLTVTKMLLKSVSSDEVVYSIYSGAALALNDLTTYLKPNSDGIGISVMGFNPDHGLKLEITASNGSTEYAENVVWAISNAAGGIDPFRLDRIKNMRGSNQYGVSDIAHSAGGIGHLPRVRVQNHPGLVPSDFLA